jgi:hypothetical protein
MVDGTGRDVPDLLLERLLAGDLDAVRRREVGRICMGSDALRTRIEELRSEREEFLEADPPEVFAHRLARMLASTPGRDLPLRWALE